MEPSEIRGEVNKAKSFELPLGYYAILTTGKVSTSAQLAVQAINQEHKESGFFEVELFTWSRIISLLRQYPEVKKQFYGGLQHETVARLETKIDAALHSATEAISVASTSDAIDRLIDEARDKINSHESQLAVLLLNRVEQTKGDVLTARQRKPTHPRSPLHRALRSDPRTAAMAGQAALNLRIVLTRVPVRRASWKLQKRSAQSTSATDVRKDLAGFCRCSDLCPCLCP